MAGKRAKQSGTESFFVVRPTKQAMREGKVPGEIFIAEKEKDWVLTQLKMLRHWPLTAVQQNRLGSDLDFSKVSHQGEKFFELRLDDAALERKNLRVFFWIQDQKRTVWIIHSYWKKSQRLDDAVKTRVARRIKDLKGAIQDGSVR
jgi:phage-related protein